MEKSGSGNYLTSFPYATEMSELLDSRPIAIEEGIDSAVSSLDEENVSIRSAMQSEVSEDSICVYLNEENGMILCYVFHYIFPVNA